MTVAELITELQALPQDALVILSSDSEGNRHGPLYQVWSGGYRAITKWSGDVGFMQLTDDERAAGFGDIDIIHGGVPAVILTPAF